MVGIVGNILTPILDRQLNAVQNTQRALDDVQLKLASGKNVNNALDDPQNFFAAQSLDNRAFDLSRLLDGIGQSLRTIEVANSGISAALNIIDQAEAFLVDIEEGLASGSLSTVDPNSAIGARVTARLANPNAVHLGNGVIVETYDSPGTITFNPGTDTTEVEYLIVGGGGGGGSSTAFSTAGSGGGGAGGAVTGTVNVTTQDYDVVIGAGGTAGALGNNSGTNGGDSSFGLNVGTNLTGIGGGGGIGGNGAGNSGGSGGGGRGGPAGFGVQPGSAQGGLGNDGGTGPSPGGHGGGGGGGAGSVGGANSGIAGGDGGDGFSSLITGTSELYAAGGGGGGANGDIQGLGGSGIGGDGANDANNAAAGVDGTGSGGGGGNNNRLGADGGDGTVILRYQITAPTSGNSSIETQYSKIVSQLDQLAIDANYRGINLLKDEDLRTDFNEERDNFILTEGIDATRLGLGLDIDGFTTVEDVQDKQDQIREARKTLRNFGFTITTDITVIQTREDFTTSTINTLESGSDDLVLADQNQVGAEFLALQTRQSVQFSVLSLSAENNALITSLL